MASWSSKRRFLYLLSFVILALFVVFLFWYSVIYISPTCFDNRQNQKEEGVDCGGPCGKACSFSVIDPLVHWTRVFEVSGDTYNVLAYAENPNFGVVAYDTPYIFRVYDARNLLVYEKRGTVFIPSKKTFPIFEVPTNIGERVPVKALFEFSQKPNWVRGEDETGLVSVRDKVLSGEDVMPRLEAVVENRSVKTLRNIELTAIIYNNDNNAIAVSKTFVDSIEGGSSKNIVFTWPQPFSSKAVKIDIIPIVELRDI